MQHHTKQKMSYALLLLAIAIILSAILLYAYTPRNDVNDQPASTSEEDGRNEEGKAENSFDIDNISTINKEPLPTEWTVSKGFDDKVTVAHPSHIKAENQEVSLGDGSFSKVLSLSTGADNESRECSITSRTTPFSTVVNEYEARDEEDDGMSGGRCYVPTDCYQPIKLLFAIALQPHLQAPAGHTQEVATGHI